jgi:hypothetical protein
MKKLSFALIAVLMLALLVGCGHTHDYQETVTAPTCTENGYTTFTCECGETYKDNEVPAAHTEQVLDAKEATCTEDGLTQGKKCSACGEVFTAQEKVDAKGHSYGEWTVTKEAAVGAAGSKEQVCSACGDKKTEEIPAIPGEFTVNYDLNGGLFQGGYATIEALGDAFLADFNTYGETTAAKESFQVDSTAAVKVALANKNMLTKWNWLWAYMLQHLQEENADATSAYITDTYPILEKMINGDTNAIMESANARTSIRSYIHGFLNLMKGCGAENETFSAFSPNFATADEQQKLLEHQFELTATIAYGTKLPVPTKAGAQFAGWKNEAGEIVTEAVCGGTLTATWN